MRLTLRTLLAYLDDVLEPADAQALGKKIEESEFAGNLVQRIRNSVKRLRLAAPRLNGKGMGLDPNTVAEYLDNVLPADRMPEFEKVCLDSDMHLAEAAACHQILTLILGEPADVETATRERVYRIGSPTVPASDVQAAMGEEPPIATSAAPGDTVVSPAVKSPPSGTRQKPEVPDYLREESGVRLWPLLATLLLCFLLAGAVIIAMGPLDATHPLAQWLGLQGNPPVAAGPQPPPPGEPAAPAAVEPAPLPGEAPIDPAAPPPMGKTPTPMEPSPPATPMAATHEPEPAPMPAPPAPPVPLPGEGAAPAVPPVVPAAEPVPGVPPAPLPMPAAEAPMGAIKVGNVVSSDDVLLRFAASEEVWQRLARGAALMAGDRILAPSYFRPQILLAGGVHVTLCAGTQVTLQPPDDAGLPKLRVDYGRVILASIGMPGTQAVIQCGERGGVLAFGDAESQVALEVRRHFTPGVDPSSAPLHYRVEAYVPSGSITWQEAGQPATPIAAGHFYSLVDAEKGVIQPVAAFPDWISAKDQLDVDKLAAVPLRDAIAFDRPAHLAFRESAIERRAEVRSLAIRSLAYLGEFDEAFNALNDVEVRATWPALVETLQESLALDPSYPERLRQALARAAVDDGPVIYRILWGYSPEQLKVEGGKQLVDALEHNTLAVRVAAFVSLRGITGQTHGYRPEFLPVVRKQYLVKWREKLASREGIEYSRSSSAPATSVRPSPAAEPPLPDLPSPPSAPAVPPVLPPAPMTPPLPGGPLFPALPK